MSLKLSYFCKKYKIFERLGLRPQNPQISPLQIFGYAPESSYVFALPISMPPEFSLMPRFKNINFHQNKPKIELFLQKIKFFEYWGRIPQTLNGFRRIGAEFPDPRNSPFPIANFWLRTCYQTYAAHTSRL